MANRAVSDASLYETSSEVDVVETFEQMGLKEDLLRGIYAYGITLEKFELQG